MKHHREPYPSRFPISEPQVSMEFQSWWEPKGIDEDTGAHYGGHPDARRLWARPEAGGRYYKRIYGIKTQTAWQAQVYRDQFEEWKASDSPERAQEFVSVAASLERQKEFWAGLKNLKIGKEMP